MIKLFTRKKEVVIPEAVDFELQNGKIASVRNYDSFQTRGESSIKMVMDALKKNPLDYTGSFRVYTGDFPLTTSVEYPMFYYCYNSVTGQENTVPDFVFDGWPQAGISSYDETTSQMSEHGDIPYKNPKMLWIGNSKTHPNRTILLDIAKHNTHIIEAYDTCVDQYILEKKEVKYISLIDHTHYKYLIDIEGRGYSGRLKLLLFSKRLVFIQEREWKEYYHDDLIPYEHFIPVKNDLSDLIDQISFVESQNKDYYDRITNNAYSYAKENLTYTKAIERISNQLKNLDSGQR